MTYYYYTIDEKKFDRTYTIEFTAKSVEERKRIIQKTIEAAQFAFAFFSQEKERVKNQVSEYVRDKREEIEKQSSLKQREYLKLLSHLEKYEDSQNKQFEKESCIDEIKKLSEIFSQPTSPVHQHSNESDSWFYYTHLGRLNSPDTVLLKIFNREANRSICSLEFNSENFSQIGNVTSKNFKMPTFEHYVSMKKQQAL